MGRVVACRDGHNEWLHRIADFVSRHQPEFLTELDLPRQRLPSLSTLRRIMVRVDLVSFTQAFNAWAGEQFTPVPDEQLATDGKGIKASVSNYDQSYQDFVS